MLSISALTRAVRLAPGTLRHYPDAGLLPPAGKDPQTSYRYYTREQERRADVIRWIREIGSPMQETREVSDAHAPAAQSLGDFSDRVDEAAPRASDAVAKFMTLLAAEDVEAPTLVEVPGPELAGALGRVSPPADADPDSALGGVLVQVDGANLATVATNRYSLTAWIRDTAPASGPARRVVLDRRTVDSLVAVMLRRGSCVLGFGGDSLRVDDSEVAIAPDRFPTYRLLLDLSNQVGGHTLVHRHPLLHALFSATGHTGGAATRLGFCTGLAGFRHRPAADRDDRADCGLGQHLMRRAGLSPPLRVTGAVPADRAGCPRRRG
jgi:DNA-binding transcriptional MerR regulator